MWEYYRYNPSLVAAIIFAVLFSLVTIVHVCLLLRTKTWYFIPLAVGGAFEIVGYIGRILSSEQTPNWTLVPYIIQTLFLLVAPPLLAASIYMELSRIVLLVDGESHCLLKRQWLSKVFVTGDILSFFIQCGGGGIMANGSISSMTLGQHIVIGGLALQLVSFGFFIVVAGVFHGRLHRYPTHASTGSVPWRKHQYALYAASILILIRSVFRVIEYCQGNDGFLSRHEYFLYVFDAALMWCVLVLFVAVHPGELTGLLAKKRLENQSGGVEYEMMQSPKSDLRC
ncbi:RTA1 like protein-domain-containing protein [Lipomyces kononenkoae]|uniref:RTA1 like protein-domain-containing protein n=1 Tax=Lipomyces kononenkoae TaxID=34357 RepID=A0ACC3T405_LIPKO